MATFIPASHEAVPSLAEYIAKTPGTCGGQPRIIGTRIKVKHVYVWVERMGMSPAQVVAEHPHRTMDQIHAALAYYWTHRDEIDCDIECEEKVVAELRTQAGPSRFQERLAQNDAADDPVPFTLFTFLQRLSSEVFVVLRH